MIDRTRRGEVLRAITAYRNGETTNRELEQVLARTLKHSMDKELRAACDDFWLTYDDLRTHKNAGRHQLTSEEIRLLERWIAVLRQDDEVEGALE